MNRPTAFVPATGRRPRPALAISAALLAVVVASLLFLAGCNVQAGVDTNVNADGSGTVGMRLAADKELQDALSGVAEGLGGKTGAILGILGDLGGLGGLGGTLPTSTDDLFNLIVGQIPGDWTAERGADSSGARWLSLTRSFSNPEELQQILSGGFLSTVIATDQFSLTQDRGFFTTKTRFSATAEGGSVTSRAQSAAGFTQSVLGEVLTVENRVTLPGAIKDNNADEVRGNTLVWSIGTSGSKEMYAGSTVYNWGAIAGTAIVGLVIIAGSTVAAILIVRRRRRRRPTPEQPGALQPAPSSAPATAEAVSPEAAGAGANAEPDVSIEPQQAAPAAPEGDVTAAPEGAVVADAPVEAETAETAPPMSAEVAETAAPAAGPAAAAAAPVGADAPRPIVPIPLRPTRAQPAAGEGAASF